MITGNSTQLTQLQLNPTLNLHSTQLDAAMAAVATANEAHCARRPLAPVTNLRLNPRAAPFQPADKTQQALNVAPFSLPEPKSLPSITLRCHTASSACARSRLVGSKPVLTPSRKDVLHKPFGKALVALFHQRHLFCEYVIGVHIE